jgi:MarR family transcriptional regulator, lower aerobic nicotinate degradation pathway regulator
MNNRPLPPRLQESTIFLMVRVMKEGHRRANNIFKGEDLRLMHYAAAAYIAHYEGVSQKILGETLLMDRSDISNIVQDLEKAGYVIRQSDTRDRRKLSLKITPTGKTWLNERDIGAHVFEEEFLASLSSEERHSFRKLLSLMLEQ